jgi:hypothetical protein
MLNRHLSEPLPGSDCSTFADLLPLLGEGLLPEPEASQVRAHLAGCAYCQRQDAAYQRIDANLRRYFGGLPPLRLSPEDMMSLFDDGLHLEGAPSAGPAPLPTAPPRRAFGARRFISILSAVAAVLIIGVVVTALIASRGVLPKHSGTANARVSSPTPTATPAPQEVPYTPNPNSDVLGAVQMISPTNGWAVGATYTPSTSGQESTSEVLILHDHNGHWMRMETPSKEELGLPDPFLESIAMVSADEGWAVGDGGYAAVVPSAFILHYSGGKWTKFDSLSDAELYAVQMLSPTDGWAIGAGDWGSGEGATSGILLHYDGTSWSPAQVPNVGGLSSLDMLSATDGWATGVDTILHYDGQRWSVFQQVQGVYDLSMDSVSDGWAIGFINYTTNHTSSSNVIWHYDGSKWVQGTLPSTVNYDAQLLGISMDSPTDGWAVGYGNGDKGEARYSLYLHYTQGHWTQVQGPGDNNVSGVTMLSADEGWAIGGSGLLLHYEHGAWSQYQF